MKKKNVGILISILIIVGVVVTALLVNLNSNVTSSEESEVYTQKALMQNYDATSGTEITPNGNTAWKKEHTVQFNIDSGEYAWLPEGQVVVGEYNNFVKGDTIKINGKTGKYRLNIRYQNASGANVNFLSEPFYLDNSLTKAGTVKITKGSAAGEEYPTKYVANLIADGCYEGGYTDENLYIKKVDGTDEQSGHKSTVYSVTKVLGDNTEIVVGNSSIEDTIIESKGNYKIVVTTTDELGNSANRTYLIHKGITNVINNSNNGNTDYELSVDTTITVKPEITSKMTLYYTWVKVGEEPTNYKPVPANGKVSLSGVSGDYQLYIKAVDEYGNETITKSKVYHLAGKITQMGTIMFKYNDENGEDYTPGTFTNKNIYLKIANQGSDEHGGKVTSTYKITRKETSGQETVIGQYTNESTVLVNDGEYTVTITSTSALGASSSNRYTVKIDKTAPTIKFTGTDEYNVTGKIGVTVKDEGLCISGVNTKVLKYYWTRNYQKPEAEDFYGTTEGGYRGNLTSTSTMVSGPAGASGIWCLWILAEDNAGNYSIKNSIVIENDGNISYMDNQAPIAGTLELKENDENGKEYTPESFTSQSVYVKLLSGYDADSGVKTNTYSLTKNGSTYRTGLTENITLTEHGQYVATITTIDNQNNQSTRQYKINIDKVGPDVTFIPNGEKEYIKQQEVEVRITETNQSGVNESKTKYKWIGYDPTKIDNIEEVLNIMDEITTEDEKELAKELEQYGIYIKEAIVSNGKITTPKNATGIYHLYVYAEDNVGNKTIKISEGYKLDNTNPTKPTIKAMKKTAGTEEYEAYYGETTKGEVIVKAEGSISVSGVDKYQYSISTDNGQTWSAWADATIQEDGETKGQVSITQEGTTIVKFRAVAELKDATLESQETDKLVVKIDKTGPTGMFANYETAENGTTAYVKNVLVRITVIDQGDMTVNPNTLKYEWIKFANVSEYNRFNQNTKDINTLKAMMTNNAKNFANGEEIPSPEEASGIYSLFVYAQDNAGNENVSYSNIYRLGGESSSNDNEYELAGEYIKRVLPETKVSTFITNVRNTITGTNYTVYDKSGKQMTSDQIVTTACTVKIDDKTYKIAVTGDLNGDGELDILDVSRMIYHTSEISTLTEEYRVAADINYDGVTDLIDLSRIMQIVVGLIKL